MKLRSSAQSQSSKRLVVSVIAALWASHSLAQSAVTIKNHRRLVATLSAITGIPANDSAVVSYMANATSLLPEEGKPEELSTTAALAIHGLAGVYCQKMIAADAAIANPAQRRAHKGLDFKVQPSDLSQTVRAGVVAEYAQLFWQRAATAQEAQALLALVDNVATTLPPAPTPTMAPTPVATPVPTNSAATLKLFLPACTAAASALATITN